MVHRAEAPSPRVPVSTTPAGAANRCRTQLWINRRTRIVFSRTFPERKAFALDEQVPIRRRDVDARFQQIVAMLRKLCRQGAAVAQDVIERGPGMTGQVDGEKHRSGKIAWQIFGKEHKRFDAVRRRADGQNVAVLPSPPGPLAKQRSGKVPRFRRTVKMRPRPGHKWAVQFTCAAICWVRRAAAKVDRDQR